jgi:hypothetical protein
MATFTAYAKVLTPDDIQYRAHEAGIVKNPPGTLLEEILDWTGGVYEVQLPLGVKLREDIRRVAELTSDEELRRIASQPTAPVSLEHLRHLDPRTTRIVLGHMLTYAEGESERLGLGHQGPYDPSKTIST